MPAGLLLFLPQGISVGPRHSRFCHPGKIILNKENYFEYGIIYGTALFHRLCIFP